MRCTVVLLALALVVSACGGDTPTAPSPSVPQIPQVAGTYTGPVTFTFSALQLEETGTGRFVVVQSGSELTISGSVTVAGETNELIATTGTVNATGFYTPTSGGSEVAEDDPTCGAITNYSESLNFIGRTLRVTASWQTAECGRFDISGTLTR